MNLSILSIFNMSQIKDLYQVSLLVTYRGVVVGLFRLSSYLIRLAFLRRECTAQIGMMSQRL